MNETAEKLREAADCVSDNTATLVQVISQVREKLDVEETDTFGGDLVAILIAIADELDELQAKANDANNLRQKLESAEKKAKCRKTHIWYLNDALRDKNDMLKQRCLAISRLTTDNSELRKKVPSERERQILAIWPRFEDGEPVMLGDKYEDNEGHECFASEVYLDIDGPSLVDSEGFHDLYRMGKRVKRPAPKVLDADGVEIKVGDTVWTLDGLEGVVTKVEDGAAYIAYESDYAQLEEAVNLTHVQPVYETRESVVYEIGEDMAKRIDAIVSAGRWK